MPSVLTSTGIERVAVCAGSGALVQIRSVNEKQAAGTEKHEAKAADPSGAARLISDLGLLPAGEVELHREIAFAWDVDRRRVRVLDGPRKYDDLTDREVGGTVDLAAVGESELTIVDWKFGRREYVTRAKDNLQLRFYALCATEWRGLDSARVALVFESDDSGPSADPAVLDSMDLAAFASELRRIVDRLQAARRDVEAGRIPPLTEGAHCTFCPAFSLCPAKLALARALARPDDLEAALQALAPDQMPSLWKAKERAKEVIRRIEDFVNGYARENGIDLGGGKVVREVERSVREIDGSKADRILGEHFGHEVARAIVEKAVTQAQMKRILSKGEFLAAMQLLDDAGAIRVKTSRTVREVAARLPGHATALKTEEA